MAQNFGQQRIVKHGSDGASLSWLETTSNAVSVGRALLVEVVSMPPIVVSVPPVSVNLSVVSVTQGQSPWVVAGDVSVLAMPPVTIATVSVTGDVSVKNTSLSPVQIVGTVSAFILTAPLDVQQTGGTPWLVSLAGPVSVTGHVSIDNTSLNPVQVTVQAFQTAVSVTGQVGVIGAVSVTGEVSVKNFPAVTSVTQGTSPWVVAGDVSLKSAVSVTGQVSVLGPVSVTGEVSIVGGQVSVVGNVSAAVAGNVSVTNTSLSPVQVTVQSFQTAILAGIIGNVSVVGQVSVLGNVSVATARVALTPGSPTHISVGTVASVAVAANAGRKGLILTNKTTANVAGIPIYLAPASVAVLGSGIVLYPNGGTWVMDEYTFTTTSISAIASAAGIASLAIMEFS